MCYRSLIDDILDGNTDMLKSEQFGEGRIVYKFDNIVVKIPKPNSEVRKSGSEQSKVEWEVWSSEKSEFLCPIYEYYRDCIVMKKLETDTTKIIELLNLSNKEEFFSYIIQHFFEITSNLSSKYKLNGEDLCKIDSFGYDYETKKLKILDYGLKSHTLT